MRQPGARIGVQPAEKPLADRMGKHFFQAFIAPVVGSEPIAVTDEKRFAVNFPLDGLPVHRNAELLLEIAKHPQVVVAGKNIDGDAGVTQLGQFAQKSIEPFGNHRFILKPEFKQVADQVNSFCFRGNVVEPADHLPFALGGRPAGIGAQMKIGGEKSFFHGRCWQAVGFLRRKVIRPRQYFCPFLPIFINQQTP